MDCKIARYIPWAQSDFEVSPMPAMRIPSSRCVEVHRWLCCKHGFSMHGAVSVPCFHEGPLPKIPATPILSNLRWPYRDAIQASSPASTITKRLKGSRPAQNLLVFTRWMRLVLKKSGRAWAPFSTSPFPIVCVGKEWGTIVSKSDIITS